MASEPAAAVLRAIRRHAATKPYDNRLRRIAEDAEAALETTADPLADPTLQAMRNAAVSLYALICVLEDLPSRDPIAFSEEHDHAVDALRGLNRILKPHRLDCPIDGDEASARPEGTGA